MKKLICLCLCFLTTFSVCSCKSSDSAFVISKADSTAESKSQTASQVSKIESTQAVPSISEISTPASSQTLPSSTPSKVESQAQIRPLPPPVVSRPELEPFGFTVNDPENTRGLSTLKKGFSYGVAKGGVAHNQSFTNQKTFDSYQNVKALALDTKTKEKIMYLTFDNGYEYKNLTASILDTLWQKNVKAAFFVTLSYVKENPRLVERMIYEGHIVGNHSSTHPSFPSLTRTQMADEIATLDNYLRKNFSYTSPYFRFPGGEHSESSLELVTSIGYKSVFWSIAHADWDTSAQKGANSAYTTVTSRFHSGAVILLHAVSQDNTLALGRIIDEAHRQGYKFKTLDEYVF